MNLPFSRAILRAAVIALAVAATASAWGYALIIDDDGFPIKWTTTPIVMKVMVDNSTHLTDGNTRATCIQAAMTDPNRGWNHYLGSVQFSPVIAAVGSGTDNDQINQIFFSATPYDQTWDSNTLAVTTGWSEGEQRVEADIIINTNFSWDSYRGAKGTKVAYDLQRVVLHELGHVLGLDHPDDHGQSVTAIMNSVISNLDSLQTDDIQGAQALYGAPGVKPANDNFANATLVTLVNDYATATGTNVAATKEAGEPNHGSDSGGHSVWWKITPSVSGALTVNTSGSLFDTTLGIYAGSSVSSLTSLAENDDVQDGVIRTSAVSVQVTGGTTYSVAVDGFGGGSGQIDLQFTFFQPVPARVTSQPFPQAAYAGQSTNFVCGGDGTPSPTYQWQRLPAGTTTWLNLSDDTNFAGTASYNLVIGATTIQMNGDQFRCVVTNLAGTATSSPALLTVYPVTAPVISGLPPSVTYNYGDYFSLEPIVTGAPPITYQWSKDGVALAGQTNPSFYKSGGALTADAGTYTITATNGGGSTTASITVTVNPPILPSFYSMPASVTLDYGGTLNVYGWYLGSPPMTFQWFKDGNPLANQTSPSLFITNVTTADSGNYTISGTNAAGIGTSNPVVVTVNPAFAPILTQFLTSLSVNYGDTLGLGGMVTGTPQLTYQWYKNGVAIPGATASAYYVPGATSADAGTYTLSVTNFVGTTTTPNIVVTINPPVAPTIAGVPDTLAMDYGGYGGFSATVTGTQPMTYQWSKNGSAIPYANYPYLYFFGTVASDAGNYVLTVTNQFGSTSKAVTLTINPPILPTITYLPATVDVFVGNYVWLSPTISGTQPYTFLWTKDGTPIATTAYCDINNVIAGDAGHYRLTVSNAAGSTSFDVNVIVHPVGPPIFTLQPVSTAVHEGGYAGFTTNCITPTAVSFQWFYNGHAMPYDTAQSLYLYNLWPNNSGSYYVVATNSFGSTASQTVRLSVLSSGLDLAGKGNSDLLWTNQRTGERRVWLMNGPTYGSELSLGNVAANWVPVAVGEFVNLQTAILWRNTNDGSCVFWAVNLDGYQGSVAFRTIPLNWRVAAAADFNNNGVSDLVLEDGSTGERQIWLVSGSTTSSVVSLGFVDPVWSISGAADFDRDGSPDILWTNRLTGERVIWLMNGTTQVGSASLGVVDRNLEISAVDDFDGDGWPDLVFTNKITSERSIWLMNGATHVGTVSLGVVPPEWTIGSAAMPTTAKLDLNGDGQADLVWDNSSTGEHYVWLMNGANLASSVALGNLPPEWRIAATGDFNGDGQVDLVWENTSTGDRYLWLMNGGGFASSVYLGTLPPAWHIVAAGDFNGDGQADLVWENSSTGERYLWLMNGTAFSTSVNLGTIGTEWHIADCADFNGDGQPDVVWENTSTGERYVWLMNGTSFSSAVNLGTISTDWRIAVAADFNGDGQTDLVWQNTSTGERYIWFMNGTAFVSGQSLGSMPVEWVIAP